MVSRVPDGFWGDGDDGFALIEVGDTLVGLQRMAAAWRGELDPLVVAVTGSNGKTSTKDFLKAALGTKFRVHATAGNFNNHIGLPLTLLAAPEDAECVVCEIGMSNPGEIAPLAEIAGPDIGVITNVGTAHIEFMGSREAIALEKGALAEAVGAEGVVVLNAEDDFTGEISKRTGAAVVTAGVGCGEVRAEVLEGGSFRVRTDLGFFSGLTGRDARATVSGSSRGLEAAATVELRVPGRHMVGNAALAAAAALAAGCELGEVGEALSRAELTGEAAAETGRGARCVR